MSALSGKLSHEPAGEERLIRDFLKDMDRSHGDLTPSIMRKVARIGGYRPMHNVYQPNRDGMNLRNSRVMNLQGSQRTLDSVHPTLAMNPSILPFDLGGSKAYSNTESDLGEENTAAYNSNPMPEYNYKELKYNLPTKYDSGYNYDDIHDKDYHDNDFHDNNIHGNGFHNDDVDYNKAFQRDDNDFQTNIDNANQDDSKAGGIGSIAGNNGESLINEIGRKVLLNIIQKQNGENTGNVKEEPELLDAVTESSMETKSPYVSEQSESLPTHKGTVMSSYGHTDQTNNLEALTKLLTSTKGSSSQRTTLNQKQKVTQILEHLGLANTGVTQEAQLPIENDLNPPNPDISQETPRKVDVGGKMNNVIDVARVTPAVVTTPTSKITLPTTTSNAAQRKIATKQNDPAANDDEVILKISGQGKPVSFKADTSSDGSLLLKIPKKFSEDFIKPSGNQATESASDRSADLSPDVIKLLAGKLAKGSLLGDDREISDWQISGKHGKGDENANAPTIDPQLQPTRKLSLPSLSSLLQYKTTDSQPDTKHKLNKNLVQAPASVLPSTSGLSVQQALGNLDTPQNLVQSVFPGLAGLPPEAQNMEQLMTLLTRMDQLPSSHVPGTVAAYSGTVPVNYAVRQEVGTTQVPQNQAFSLKGVLKTSQLAEDSGVARNKGIMLNMNSQKKADEEWSPCTVTCGQGIQARARPCEGKYCSGYTTESRPCNAGPCPEQLAKEGLKLHNTFRVWHHSPKLKWSPSLAKKAQKLADDLARNNDSSMVSAEMKELPGENIAVILSQDYNSAAETATRQWYGEVKGYNFEHPTMNDDTRHFTQIVWKGTKKAGIGIARSKANQNVYVVALYDPPGNIESQGLKKNVKMPDTSQT